MIDDPLKTKIVYGVFIALWIASVIGSIYVTRRYFYAAIGEQDHERIVREIRVTNTILVEKVKAIEQTNTVLARSNARLDGARRSALRILDADTLHDAIRIFSIDP